MPQPPTRKALPRLICALGSSEVTGMSDVSYLSQSLDIKILGLQPDRHIAHLTHIWIFGCSYCTEHNYQAIEMHVHGV